MSRLDRTTGTQDWEWDPLLDAELPFFETFRFLDLPAEVRLHIYQLHLRLPRTVDLDLNNKRNISPLLRLFQVNRQIFDEAHHVFYGINTFRLFSTSNMTSRKHVLTQMRPRTRAALSTLELRLGPGFANPPKTWNPANVRLGLKDCKNLRVLKIFVELDPMSQPTLSKWRSDDYNPWAQDLLQKLLSRLPDIQMIVFDGWKSVKKDGSLMKALLEEVHATKLPIVWGPERGWDDGPEKETTEQANAIAGPMQAWYPGGSNRITYDYLTLPIPMAMLQA